MDSTRHDARVAGHLYLLSAITAPFSLLYVPLNLIVPGDATATANHVRAHETLLRPGELAIMLWLLIVGATPRPQRVVAA